MIWHVVLDADGTPVSFGTVVADPLPDGYTAVSGEVADGHSPVYADGQLFGIEPPTPPTPRDVGAEVDALARVQAEALAAADVAIPYRPVTGAHDAWPPRVVIRFTDGHRYRNVSGGWLSHGPDEYARGWEDLDAVAPEPDPDTGAIPWVEGDTFAVDDLRSFDGGVYRCISAHTAWAGTGWTPAVSPSLWSPI